MSHTALCEEQESAWDSTIDGLYLAGGNFVRPEEESIWKDFNASFWQDLVPVSPAEAFLVNEIVRAAWRVRRCNNVEASLINRLSDPSLDPMEDPATSQTQTVIDRARSQAEHSFERSIAELRRIQTERQFRNEAFPEGANLAKFGVATFRQILPAIRRNANAAPFKAAIARFNEMAEPDDAGLTPRNAPCPCGSGQKHKRCCGKNAPPVLCVAA